MTRLTLLGWLSGPVPDLENSPPAIGPSSPVAVFRLTDHADPARTAAAMLAVGRVHADGEVTAAEAASLAVYLWPGLEGDAGRVASVISAIEHARKGMADDGKLTGEEVLEVTLDLLRALRDTIKISDLHGWARWVIEGVIGRRTNDRSAGP